VKLKIKYFCNFWNCFELVMVFLVVLSLTSHVVKVLEDSAKAEQIAQRQREFVSLAKNFEADERLAKINAFIMFMLTIWIVKQTRFVKSWSILGNTLRVSLPFLLGLTLIVTILVLIYAQLGYLWYNSIAMSFSSMSLAFSSLVVLMRGTFTDLENMLQFDAVFTQLYIMSFMALTLITIMALVVAILNSTYHTLKMQVHYYNNMDLKDYEMIEFTIRRFKRWMGLTKEKPAFRRVKFQGLPSASTASSFKSGIAPGSVGSSGSSGMSEVMDILEAESQAYLDGLLERALPTWNNMLHQLTLVEQVDDKERKIERDVYEKLLQVRIRLMKEKQDAEEERDKQTSTSECKRIPRTGGPELAEESTDSSKSTHPSRSPASSKHLRRFSEQIQSKTNKTNPTRAHSDMGSMGRTENTQPLSKTLKSSQPKPAW